jgi:hypothetical protein
MRRKKAQQRARSVPIFVPVLLAGCAGYLLGNAHIEAFRSGDSSAADTVASRFPQEWKDASRATAALFLTAAMKIDATKSTVAAATPATARHAQQVALFSPQPMMPQADREGALQPTIQTASAEDTDISTVSTGVSAMLQAAQPQAPESASALVSAPISAPMAVPMPAAKPAAAAAPAAKAAAAAAHHPVNDRPGYILNDAQIASIKERLHLTPGQEEMWPAVEAALRNMAYSRAPSPPRGRGVPAGTTQTAAVDPNAVQDLKSAAVPLIMSFNSEQKDEVRNLVHVMGLDQLASQF